MCASRVPHLPLPVARAGSPHAVRGGGAVAMGVGPGAGGSTSPLTSWSPAPSVSHVSHTKLHRLREQVCGHAPHEPGARGSHRAWPTCCPCDHSPRAVRTGSLREELMLFLADRRETDMAAWRIGCARWRPNWRRRTRSCSRCLC